MKTMQQRTRVFIFWMTLLAGALYILYAVLILFRTGNFNVRNFLAGILIVILALAYRRSQKRLST